MKETTEKKYYTPKIEEFHVGFEYEIHLMSVGGLVVLDSQTKEINRISEPDIKVWEPTVYNNDIVFGRTLDNIQQLINNNQIRVKYLDQEDIESLGFILKHTSIDLWFERPGVFLRDDGYHLKNIKLNYGTHDQRLKLVFDYTAGETQVHFEGQIKNKSELKRLLKQRKDATA